MSSSMSSSPHVLMFPLPAQGDLKPLLNLAELLCLANVKVTFVNTVHNHRHLTRHSDIEARFSRYPGFGFRVVPDGLPDDHPRAGGNWLFELLHGLRLNGEPLLREIMIMPHGTSQESPRVTCLIADATLSFAFEVAKEAGVPTAEFRATGASYLWAYFCIPKLIEAGEVPFGSDEADMNQLVQNVPGMNSFLRLRDLPSMCRVKDRCHPELQFIIKSIQRQPAHPLILNTFDDLEGPVLPRLHAYYPKVYSIGPLHAHLKHKLGNQETTPSKSSTSSSLWEEDHSCTSWLDEKPDKSVVYVSFGSLAILSRDEFLEIWAGLVQSNRCFLWVVRPDMLDGHDPDNPFPSQLLQGTKERGCIVGWAPQEEVLSHRAVGGFLTHSGWNSTLESITAGVPMLCWPAFYDQQVNSRYVSEVLRIGLDMKDTCDRAVVEKLVNELMDGKREELQRSAARMSDMAKRSVAEGGSSRSDLDSLIEDIKLRFNKV